MLLLKPRYGIRNTEIEFRLSPAHVDISNLSESHATLKMSNCECVCVQKRDTTMGCQAVKDHLRIVQKRAKMKAINVHFDGKTNLVFLLDDIEHMKKFIKFSCRAHRERGVYLNNGITCVIFQFLWHRREVSQV